MVLTMNAAHSVQQASKNLQRISKLWDSGDTIRILMPLWWDPDTNEPHPIVGACWGHRVHYDTFKDLGRGFIPSRAKLDPESHQILDQDLLARFSHLARLIWIGQRERELKAVRDNDKLIPKVKEAQLDAIKLKYDSQNNLEAIRPVLGRLEYRVTSEVIGFQVGEDDQPIAKRLGLYTMDLSEARSEQIRKKILAAAKYRPEPGDRYLEISMTMGSTGKRMRDAQSDPDGVTMEYRVAKRYPDIYSKLIAPLVERLPTESDLIMKRYRDFRPVDEATLYTAFSHYVHANVDAINALEDEDAASLTRSVDLLREFEVDLTAITCKDLTALPAASLTSADVFADAEEQAESAAGSTADPNGPPSNDDAGAGAPPSSAETTPAPSAGVSGVDDLLKDLE